MATELKLCVDVQDEKSVVKDFFFSSPLKLGLPNYEGERLNVILMMASAGILKGDEFCYHVSCKKGTKTLLTEQSYTKIFDTGDGSAKRHQTIQLEEEASLYYYPCAVIPFQNSTYDGDITVNLMETSEFAYADILASGRVGMGECFGFCHYRNRICVELNGVPIWMDHCVLEPKTMDVSELIFFDGYTHQGTFYYYGSKEKQERLLRWQESNAQRMKEELVCGVTNASQGICIWVLANTAQDIEELFSHIKNLLETN